MKRLKYFLLQMDNNTTTFHTMYEGRTVIPPGTPGNPTDFAQEEFDPTYWVDSIAVTISKTNKLMQDKPTLVWQIPVSLLGIESCTAAAADYCLRAFAPYVDALNGEIFNRNRTDKENGKYILHQPGPEILVRNTAYFASYSQKDYNNGSGCIIYILEDGIPRPPQMYLCIRMQVQLPEKKIRKTIQMLCRDLPDAVERFVAEFDRKKLEETLRLSERQKDIRAWLKNSSYCAFVANGAMLPRAEGSVLPLTDAVPFQSPPEDVIEICGIRGMGIRRGVTVITGGGYSGKSTLLDAISAGIYDHVPGDGRELCITDDSAMTISAEDGRSVKHMNILPFVKWLPSGNPSDFTTEHASGSTSQAANIMEAVEAGTGLLLIDEDRSATNFMIRDSMMKELVEKEPLTPFTDRVQELYHRKGVSTILVIGGSGEYLSVADKVYMMADYRIHDVTARAREICQAHGLTSQTHGVMSQFHGVTIQPTERADWSQRRVLLADGFTSYPKNSGSERLAVSDMGFLFIGDESIDVRGLHDIISEQQLNALGFMLRYLEISNNDAKIDIVKKVSELYEKMELEGVDSVFSSYFTTCGRFLDLPRRQEFMALINRMREVHWTNLGGLTEENLDGLTRENMGGLTEAD